MRTENLQFNAKCDAMAYAWWVGALASPAWVRGKSAKGCTGGAGKGASATDIGGVDWVLNMSDIQGCLNGFNAQRRTGLAPLPQWCRLHRRRARWQVLAAAHACDFQQPMEVVAVWLGPGDAVLLENCIDFIVNVLQID